MKYFFSSLIMLMSTSFLLHPFHVAVSDIEYDSNQRTIEVSQRLFSDDFSEAMIKKGLTEPDWSNEQLINTLLRDYLHDNLQFKVNGKGVEANFLGYEYEPDSWTVWCYLEITRVRKLNSLEITNTLLTDTFEDQENIIHMKYGAIIDSKRLKSPLNTALFKYK